MSKDTPERKASKVIGNCKKAVRGFQFIQSKEITIIESASQSNQNWALHKKGEKLDGTTGSIGDYRQHDRDSLASYYSQVNGT
jgi:hypothetical protein